MQRLGLLHRTAERAKFAIMRTPYYRLVLLALTLSLSINRGIAADSPLTVATDQEFSGWHDAIILRNGVVEAVIVPSVGRVMQFRFVGETDGPLWVNEKLAGKPMPADPWKTTGSFGGDKTWPAPQKAWNWPPPDVFDAVALKARVNPDRSVILESPESPRFGIRTVRRIVLDPVAPVLRIETTFEKISGAPSSVSIWVISQLRDPVALIVPLPANSIFPDGLAPGSAALAGFGTREGNWLRLTRDHRAQKKLSNDASTLVWAGEKELLRIDQPRIAGATYPDNGCSAQVYTNADPVAYVELEMFGPLQTLHPGEKMSATNTYRLARRTTADLDADVRALLAP